MSYLDTGMGADFSSIASGVSSAVGSAVSSIAGAFIDYRAIEQQQRIAGLGRQIGMETLVSEQDYLGRQALRESEIAKAEADARQEAERVLQEQEESIRREILSARSSRLRSGLDTAHGRGRASGSLLWLALGVGGIGLAIGAAVLLSKVGD